MADLKEFALSKVAGGVSVDLSGTGQTTLYTVPTGKIFIPVLAILRVGADASTSVITIGRVGALTDFLGSQTLSNIDASGDMAILQPVPAATPVLLKTYAAGVVIQVDVTTAAGGASNEMDLFGFLIDA